MRLNRRQVLILGAGATAVAAAGVPTMSIAADDPTAQQVIDKFTGGAAATSGRVDLGTPEIAENGNTVPIQVSVESPMTTDDHVAEVLIVADGNPRPDVAVFKFTELSGEAAASTRIRLAKTQNVIAVAKMSDGSFFMAKNAVKVTIGGCGG
ncbi:MAG: thiosulfate oxidation carrier protein SoxY [Rhizobiaceae bacterium]|nr:thiosulfate oxidation carrier protein SoxY [Rhizobiaceae bacterium]